MTRERYKDPPSILAELDAAKQTRRDAFVFTAKQLADIAIAKPAIVSGLHSKATLARVLKRRYSIPRHINTILVALRPLLEDES